MPVMLGTGRSARPTSKEARRATSNPQVGKRPGRALARSAPFPFVIFVIFVVTRSGQDSDACPFLASYEVGEFFTTKAAKEALAAT